MRQSTIAPAGPYEFGSVFSGRFLEWVGAACSFFCLATPRGSFIFLALFLVGLLLYQGLQKPAPKDRTQFWDLSSQSKFWQHHRWLWCAIAVFFCYALVSASWSIRPEQTLLKLLHVGIVFLVFFLILSRLGDVAAFDRWQLMRGVVHGALLAMVYLTVEQATLGGVKAFLANETGLIKMQQSFVVGDDGRVLSIRRHFLNRHTAALALLFWPIIAALVVWLKDWPKLLWASATVLFVWTAGLVFVSDSETAKLAFVVGAICFVVSQKMIALARWCTTLAWAIVTLLIIPLVLLFGTPGSVYVKSLPASAQDRILIWDHTASRIKEAPILGVGANMTRYVYKSEPSQKASTELQPRLSFHAHNIFLQTWFEMGLIGAVLLCLIGVLGIQATRALPSFMQPFSLSFISVVTITGLTGYGMWQVWLVSVVLWSIVWMVSAVGEEQGKSDIQLR